MTIADLEPFVSGNQGRMEKPWSQGEFTYASDGFVVVRIPRLAEVPEITNPVNAVNIFNKNPKPSEGFIPLPTTEQLGELKVCPKCHGEAREVCPECDGDGELDLETDFNTYTVTCKSCCGDGEDCGECNGTGTIEPTPKVAIAGKRFTTAYIRKFMKLPNARIAVHADPSRPSWIEFDGGDGLLMAVTECR
mgnify:CR=1 FL=1